MRCPRGHRLLAHRGDVAAGVAVTMMLLAQRALKEWLASGLGGAADHVDPSVARAAFEAGNGLQPSRPGTGSNWGSTSPGTSSSRSARRRSQRTCEATHASAPGSP